MPKMSVSMGIFVLLLVGGRGWAAGDGTSSSSAVAGVIGVTPVHCQTCLAVWIPVGSGEALGGLRWYNNDGTVAFPRLLLASGSGEVPAPIIGATAVAANVLGVSSGWSEVVFSEPVASGSTGLYAIFQLPEGSEHEYRGAGGGAGIGYRSIGGLAAWVSLDGEEWIGLHPGYSLAVEPTFMAAAAGMMVMSKRAIEPEPSVVPAATALLAARPNPFNPKTEIRFTLRRAGQVDLTIYSLRGERVLCLVGEERPAGDHVVEWKGCDGDSRPVPSGVYVARLRADGVVQSRRLLLVK